MSCVQLLPYLNIIAVKGTDSGPLFRLTDSTPLLKSHIVEEALLSFGYDQMQYTSHSYRIGDGLVANQYRVGGSNTTQDKRCYVATIFHHRR